jgi:hypothetical protein
VQPARHVQCEAHLIDRLVRPIGVEPPELLQVQASDIVLGTAGDQAHFSKLLSHCTEPLNNAGEVALSARIKFAHLLLAQCYKSPDLDPRGALKQMLLDEITEAKESKRNESNVSVCLNNSETESVYPSTSRVSVRIPLSAYHTLQAELACAQTGFWSLSCGIQTQYIRTASSEVFQACRLGGDIQRLQRLFVDGKAHPNDVDSDGRSLVHHTIYHCDSAQLYEKALDTVAFLTRCGVDCACGLGAIIACREN